MQREKYPRPDMVREKYIDLNGEWKFCFDDKGIGEKERWYLNGVPTDEKIVVPFCYQSKVSGICDKRYHEIMWYERRIEIKERGEKCLLHFGAADHHSKIWVNGQCAGEHIGGNTAFCLDITDFVLWNQENCITVQCIDKKDCTQARGKQFWGDKGERIWYTPVSGIWKSVWMEFTGDIYVKRLLLTPDIDRRCITAELELNSFWSDRMYQAQITITHEDTMVKTAVLSLPGRNSMLTIDLPEGDYADEIQYWSPENPWLYDMDISIIENTVVQDQISSYFGMRKISIRGNEILLNNKPYTQRLVLDQGYWKNTLLTPPNVEALELDIKLAKEMGFNGARKHQKIEDARYYYLASKLGFLVWGELPSAYQFCTAEMEELYSQWKESVLELYNHPSVVVWVPLNESWGVRNIVTDKKQQMFAASMYRLTKALDGTRLVSNNDGWEQIEDSDICGIHDYTADGEVLKAKFKDFSSTIKSRAEHRLLYADGHRYYEKPVLLTEFGGIAFESENKENWGYYGAVKGEEEFFERFGNVMKAAETLEAFCGYCYTQLTDVFQETNGLLNFDRSPKVELAKIRECIL